MKDYIFFKKEELLNIEEIRIEYDKIFDQNPPEQDIWLVRLMINYFYDRPNRIKIANLNSKNGISTYKVYVDQEMFDSIIKSLDRDSKINDILK